MGRVVALFFAAVGAALALAGPAQGLIGPGPQQRVMEVARKYACPVQ